MSKLDTNSSQTKNSNVPIISSGGLKLLGFEIVIVIQGILVLCEFHYCDFSKLSVQNILVPVEGRGRNLMTLSYEL